MKTDKELHGLVKRHAYGIRAEVKNSVQWLDDNTLLYPVGNLLALHSITSNSQRFIDSNCKSKAITAVAVSANKKFVALAEGGENPLVQIIDVVTRKRRKVLSVPDLGSERIIAMSFSADGRHLVTQGAAPEWNLYYWNWERSKPLAMVPMASSLGVAATTSATASALLPPTGAVGEETGGSHSYLRSAASAAGRAASQLISAVSICPSDPLTITVSGVGLMRYYRYVEGVLQPQTSCGYAKEPQDVFVTHQWVSGDCVVASTLRGEMIVIEKGHYVGSLMPPNKGLDGGSGGVGGGGHATGGGGGASTTAYAGDVPATVTCIEPCKSGFIAGTDKGDLLFYEHTEDATTGFHLSYVAAVPDREAGQTDDLLQELQGADGAGPADPSKDTAATNNLHATSTAATNHNSRSGGAAGVSQTLSGSSLRSNLQGLFQVTNRSDLVTAGSSTTNAAGRLDGEGGAPAATTNAAGSGTAAARSGGGGGGNHSSTMDQQSVTMIRDGNLLLAGSLPHGVVSLALDQLEHTLVVVTISAKLFSVPLQRAWFTADVASGKLLPPQFASICQPFHSGSIRGMDCSVRKPYLMTSSSDHSVRLWNTQTKKLELCEYYKQLPGALALHPSGLMAVICFPDKVHVMSILWDSLHDRKIINFRNTTDVKFCAGGQYFAVSHGNVVDVFDSATLENLGQLRGHPQRVLDFQWCASSPYPTDDRLVTCSPDGMIVDWSSKDLRKETEHSDKRFQYTCVASDEKSVWAVGVPTSAAAAEQHYKVTLRELERHSLGVAGGTSEDFHFKDTALTCLQVAPHQRLLFAGGEDGTLKFMTFPLQSSVQEPPLTAHGLAVTKVVLSFDESTLFTASADGSIIIWDVISEDGTHRVATGTSDEVLVTQHELDEKQVEVEGLQQQLERLKTDIEGDEKRKNHEQRTRMREKEDEFKSDAAARDEQYATMYNIKSTQERSFVAIKLEKEAEAARELEVMERHLQADVEELEAECTKLQETLDTSQTQHAQSLQDLEQRLQQQLAEEEAHFQDVLAQKREALAKLRRQVDRSKQANQEALHQLELDTDAESQEVATQHTGNLRMLRESYLHMKGEGAIMRKNAVRTEKEIEVRTGELQLLDRAKAALSSQLAELSMQLTQLHQDIDGRDGTIGEREKEIYALKRQNQELEKHKFVLDHRIRQLKAQMEPKQREIALQNQKVTQKNKDLEEFYASNQTLHGNIEELKEDIAQQQQQSKKLMNKIKDIETYMQTARKDISDLAPVVQEPAQLTEVLQRLYNKHVAANGGTRVQQADPQVKQEFSAQLGYLASSVDALRKSVKVDQNRHRAEMSEMMEENLALIREIHSLRATIQQLRNRIAADDASKRVHSSAAAATTTGKRGGTRGGAGGGGVRRAASTHNTSSNNNNTATDLGKTAEGGGAGASRKDATTSDGQERQPPKILEANKINIQMQRAYIEAMERALAEANSKLPPIQ